MPDRGEIEERKKQIALRKERAKDPRYAATRRAVLDVSKALLDLHRALMDAAREEYAEANGPIESQAKLLELLMGDPFFAWLRPLSGLIIEVDELSDGELRTEEVKALGKSIQKWIDGSDTSSPFTERYLSLLQTQTEVVVAHHALRKALKGLESGAGEPPQ